MNAPLPNSLQVIKADQQAKDAKALIGMMKRSNTSKSPKGKGTAANSGRESQKRL
jgi:hypothetical protein